MLVVFKGSHDQPKVTFQSKVNQKPNFNPKWLIEGTRDFLGTWIGNQGKRPSGSIWQEDANLACLDFLRKTKVNVFHLLF